MTNPLLQRLLTSLEQLLGWDKQLILMQDENAQKFVAAAEAALGQNLSLGTGVSPEVACAISVNLVHYRAFGVEIGGGASTQELYQVLLKHPNFKEVSVGAPGCVVISPTGYGSNPAYPHGHVGIQGEYGICSNDSNTGLLVKITPQKAGYSSSTTQKGILSTIFSASKGVNN